MPYIRKSEDEADWATDAYRLADRLPRHAWHMEGVKDLRHEYRAAERYGTTSVSPDTRHVASIPWYVMTALYGMYGEDLWADKAKKFYKWLAKHPEYKVAR